MGFLGNSLFSHVFLGVGVLLGGVGGVLAVGLSLELVLELLVLGVVGECGMTAP